MRVLSSGNIELEKGEAKVLVDLLMKVDHEVMEEQPSMEEFEVASKLYQLVKV